MSDLSADTPDVTRINVTGFLILGLLTAWIYTTIRFPRLLDQHTRASLRVLKNQRLASHPAWQEDSEFRALAAKVCNVSLNRRWIIVWGFALALGIAIVAFFGFIVFLNFPGVAVAVGVVGAGCLTFLATTAAFGERVGLVSWLGVAGGFVGVIIVMRPDFHEVNTHALFAMLCGVFVALQLILGRQLSAVTGVLGMSAFGGLVGVIAFGVYMPFVWQPISGHGWLLVALLGTTTAANLSLILFAFSQVEASVLAPFTYFEILAGVLVGFVWFGDAPDAVSWTGIGVILVSGAVVARFQQRAVE